MTSSLPELPNRPKQVHTGTTLSRTLITQNPPGNSNKIPFSFTPLFQLFTISYLLSANLNPV